jgi:hypothetical protein
MTDTAVGEEGSGIDGVDRVYGASVLTDFGPPSVGFVVHEVRRSAREADAVLWAWCRAELGQAGYTSVTYTEPDGETLAEPPPSRQLGRVLFQVWC